MIKLIPVDTPNKHHRETNDDYQQFLIYADEPVTINVCKIPCDSAHDGVGIHAFVYRGVLAQDDETTEPIFVYDGSLGHEENVEQVA